MKVSDLFVTIVGGRLSTSEQKDLVPLLNILSFVSLSVEEVLSSRIYGTDHYYQLLSVLGLVSAHVGTRRQRVNLTVVHELLEPKLGVTVSLPTLLGFAVLLTADLNDKIFMDAFLILLCNDALFRLCPDVTQVYHSLRQDTALQMIR